LRFQREFREQIISESAAHSGTETETDTGTG
jgi:hypothetical protein